MTKLTILVVLNLLISIGILILLLKNREKDASTKASTLDILAFFEAHKINTKNELTSQIMRNAEQLTIRNTQLLSLDKRLSLERLDSLRKSTNELLITNQNLLKRSEILTGEIKELKDYRLNLKGFVLPGFPPIIPPPCQEKPPGLCMPSFFENIIVPQEKDIFINFKDEMGEILLEIEPTSFSNSPNNFKSYKMDNPLKATDNATIELIVKEKDGKERKIEIQGVAIMPE